ncbi:C40 family peptidase [Oceanobacillus damuensis]|uniref:hypothetical protein n=1 Tax=Oceanobacillus damuensis TaxID=937928 RepID=UPI0008322545|nr:hypothetical protein [Oceanobacillus damuensis]
MTNYRNKELDFNEPIHFYPGTPIRMIPGDVLYSHKTALSSLVVGHSGIVGEDFRIYHVNRWGKNGHADSMRVYLSRHKKGEKLTVLRSADPDEARNAAKWAKQHIGEIKTYHYTRDLNDLENNYCSKFVWQAFYFGNDRQINLTGLSFTPSSKKFIMPAQIYRNLNKVSMFDYDFSGLR